MTSDWEARYQAGDTPWDKGAPSPGLVDFLQDHPDLPRGAVCVPGCGTGHDIIVWARAGFVVTGYDLAPSGVAAAEKNIKQAGVTAAVLKGDFLRDPPPGDYDWLFEHTLFCAIDPALRPDYVAAVSRWLKPRGEYLAVNYLITDEDGPPYPTTREEQWLRFSPGFELIKEWVPRSYPNRTGLERMFWWRKK